MIKMIRIELKKNCILLYYLICKFEQYWYCRMRVDKCYNQQN